MRVPALILLTILAGCAARTPAPVVGAPAALPVAPAPPPITPPANASTLPIVIGSFADLPGWPGTDPAAALTPLRIACPALLRRADTSGLTRPGDWTAPCAAATSAADPRAFFEANLVPVTVGDGTGLDTGYFELTLAGARERDAVNAIPLHAPPPDLIDVDLGQFSAALAGKHVRGRVEGQRLVPYPDRAAIEDGVLGPDPRVIAWVADPVEAFFLAIQGSGRVTLADGTELRIGYAGQNGRDYTGIGRLLRERGLLAPGQASMEGIVAWLHAHPAEGRTLMRENRSYVFFRPLTGPGPLGALGVPLTPKANVAADPAFVPLGAPLFLSTRTVDGPMARVVIAADTGGAIKGPNRLDWFTGAGARARRLASGQSATGRVWLLLPRSAAERLRAPPR